jgi:putative oxidoreductase
MLSRIWSTKPLALDLGLLFLRLSVGLLMMTHGWPKFVHNAERVEEFPDPLGVGRPASLLLTIFAELFCSALLTIGLFTRVALIPLIITMIVIVFMVHGSDPLGDKEHGILFLMPYLALLLAGPGAYSADRLLKR